MHKGVYYVPRQTTEKNRPEKRKNVINLIEELGFEYHRATSHGFRWKHPRKNCTIQIPGSTGDHRSVQNSKSQIRRVLTQECQPPFDPNGIVGNLKYVRVGLIPHHLNIGGDGMDSLDDALDEVFELVESYEEVSMTTSMQSQYKKRLKEIAGKRGLRMGEVIEEMIDLYELHQ